MNSEKLLKDQKLAVLETTFLIEMIALRKIKSSTNLSSAKKLAETAIKRTEDMMKKFSEEHHNESKGNKLDLVQKT